MAALYTLKVAPQFAPNKLFCFVFLSKERSCSIVSLLSFPGMNQYHFTPVELSFPIEILWFVEFFLSSVSTPSQIRFSTSRLLPGLLS